MALSTDLSGVTGDTRVKVKELIARAASELGLDLRIRSSRRTCAEQAELYGIGRQPGDTRQTITNAQGCHSWHVLGRAVDFDIYYVQTGKKIATRAPQAQMGALAQSMGFIWGGDGSFGFDDPSHVEYHPGLNISQICTGACRDDLVDTTEASGGTNIVSKMSWMTILGMGAVAALAVWGGMKLAKGGSIKRNPIRKSNPIAKADIEALGRAYIQGKDMAHSPEAQRMASAQAGRVHREFAKLQRKVRVEFTSRDPYKTFEAMVDDIRVNKRMFVYTGASETPLWDERTNWMARAVHDWDHYEAMVDFSLLGELAAYRIAANRAPSLSPLYFSEIALQAAAYQLHGSFPSGTQKLVIVPEHINRKGLIQNPISTANANTVLTASTLLTFMPRKSVMAHLASMDIGKQEAEVILEAAILTKKHKVLLS